MKVLITGGRGQLGLELSRRLSMGRGEKGLIQSISVDLDELDITDAQSVHRFVAQTSPDIIVNCAAMTDVDGCESREEVAMRVNGEAPGILAAAARECGAKMLQISTDYVFDGTARRPLREDDPVHPINVYGRSKLLGEERVRQENSRHYILRTAWLYGDGRNFVRTMLSLAREKDEISVVDDQIGTPTNTADLTDCIVDLIRTEHYGTYHGTCEGACSWYRFAETIFAEKGVRVRLIPTTTAALNRLAPRPRYSVLENAGLKTLGLNRFRPWEEALRDYLRQEP